MSFQMRSHFRKSWVLVNFELPCEKHKLLKKIARQKLCSFASLLRLAVDKIIEENQK